MITHSF